MKIGSLEYVFENEEIGYVRLTDRMVHDHALKVVNTARVSYDSKSQEFTDKDQKLTKYLWDNEHTSPFRHSYYTFEVKFPLFVARQWLKYQVGSTWRTYTACGQDIDLESWDEMFDIDKGCSWNELSGRFKQLKPEFYIPHKYRQQSPQGSKQKSVTYDDFDHEAQRALDLHLMDTMYDEYTRRLDSGICREQARSILPQSIYSTAYWTVSLQSVLWFLHQRLKEDAQYEIMKYAEGIHKLIKKDLDKLGIEI